MARYHEPWTLTKRVLPSGRTVFYFRAYDATQKDRRTAWKSTGCARKGDAIIYCRKLEREGRLLAPDAPLPEPERRITFGEYARGFWDWDGPYIHTRLQFSAPGAPDITRRHADVMARMVESYLLPRWKKVTLDAITPLAIEEWALGLRDKRGLSGKRVNDMVSCLRTMLREASRSHKLAFDPGQRGIIRTLGNATKQRGRLTVEEVRVLFADESIEKAWTGRLLYRVVNLTAAATGCRQGELLALRDDDVRDGYLHVAHSWDHKYGLGPTKTKQARDVPLPSRVRAAMEPYLGSGGFVFSMDGGVRPCSGNRVTGALYEALDAIGVKDRKERNITFHSWRHWLNSVLRVRGVPDDLVRRVTGHETPEMTEAYTEYLAEDFRAVAKVQAEVFG